MQSITLQTSDSAITAGDILGRINFAASSEGDGGAAQLEVGSIYSYAEGTFSSAANPASIIIATSASDTSPAQPRLKVTNEGHVLPVADSSYDLGSSSLAFRNTYTDTLYIGGTAITATAAELNKLDGVTATTAELNKLDGVTATTAELNRLDGITATTAELNYTDGVTSNIQTQLNAKAALASPSFTGTPSAPTAAAGTNTTQLATTAFVSTAVANLVDSAPTTLDTLNELAAALGDDANFSTTVTNSIATKLTASNNLSDLANAGTARTNLGLGSLATLSAVGAAQITDNTVGAAELNVTGNGTTAQFLRSDGDGSFTWATPTDTNTTYSAGNGISLSSTTFSVAAGGGLTQDTGGLSHADTSSAADLTASSRTYVTALTFDTYGHVTGYSTATETVTDTNTTYSAGTSLTLTGTTFSVTSNGIGATQLNVTGNGTTSQFLRSDGDGSFTWATPSVSNITTSDIAAATLVIASEGIGSNDNDTTLPTSAAVKAYVDSVALSGAGLGSVVEDTTPQLGGDLDANGNNITYSASLSFVNASNTSISLTPTAILLNSSGANVDVLIKGDTDPYLLYGDASTDRVGIGTNTPGYLLDVDGTANATTLSIGGTAITATAAELNKLDGVTATTTELNYIDGVTSNIQTQLNAKAATSSLGTLATLNSVNAATITDNSVGAAELNVTGNGTTAQFLRSDGDGTFTWATPTDTNTTYSAGGGLSLSSTTFSHADTSSAANLTASSRTYVTALTFDTYGHVTGYSTGTETVTNTNTTYTAGTGLALSGTTFNVNVDATTQTVAANTVSATSSRTYAVQVNASDELVVNVPWVDTNTNTTYSAGGGLSLAGTTFSHSDTSSAANLTASSRTYVTALTFDTYGHVTGYSTGTETVTDTNTTYSAGTSLTLTGTTFSVTANGIGATQLNVTGNGTTSQYLRSDGDGTFTWATPPDTNTQLTEEQVEDYVGGMVTGNTETLITVTYQDADGTLDFVVDNNLANYSNANSKFVESDNTGITGADEVTNIVALTQAEYDALGSKSATTLYFIYS